MARKPSVQAQALMDAERADREESADINEAIARTDSEVFTDAMGDEPLDNDGGTELEEMGEGLEGEELDEEEDQQPPPATPEGEEEAAEEGEPEAEKDEAEVEEGEEGEQVAPVVAEQRPPQPSIPPRVLREQRERARETENELRSQLRDMQMRLDNLARQPAPQPQPQQPTAPPPAPDMFADPEGYRNWVLGEAERRAEARFNDRFGQYQQQQQREVESRLNDSLAQTASGPRSYEFNVAYRDLTSLDKTPENANLVRKLVSNQDPGQAILDWWEQSSNPEYVEYHREVVRQAYAAQRPQRSGTPQRQNGRLPLQNRQNVRHEVRLPRSLSEATGGRSQHVNDPEMMDGAEESIFAYGARR